MAETMSKEQGQLFFFLWSFAMVLLLRLLHISLFSWTAIVLLFFFWPKSLDSLLENNSLCGELTALTQLYLVRPISYLLLNLLADLCLAPYAFYLTFSLDISPFLPRISIGGVNKANEKTKKEESKPRRPSIVLEDVEIVAVESLDSTSPFSSPETWTRSPTRRFLSPKAALLKKQIKIDFLEPSEENSLEGLLSNSYEYLQEHGSVALPPSRETFCPSPELLSLSPCPAQTPASQPLDVADCSPASRQMDYLTKLQRVARQRGVERKRRSMGPPGLTQSVNDR
jgi:hypothetical protein